MATGVIFQSDRASDSEGNAQVTVVRVLSQQDAAVGAEENPDGTSRNGSETPGGLSSHENYTIITAQKRPGRRERQRQRLEKERQDQERREQHKLEQRQQDPQRREKQERLERERAEAEAHRLRERAERERLREERRLVKLEQLQRQEAVIRLAEERRRQNALDRHFPLKLYISASVDTANTWSKSKFPYLLLEEHRAGCYICMMDFEGPMQESEYDDETPELVDQPEPLRLLPCGHAFHQSCVDPWILNESTTCPYCRKETQFEL